MVPAQIPPFIYRQIWQKSSQTDENAICLQAVQCYFIDLKLGGLVLRILLLLHKYLNKYQTVFLL